MKLRRAISATIEEISVIAGDIGASITVQSSATSDLVDRVERTSEAARELTTGIGGVRNEATETGAAGKQVLSAAMDLSSQAARLYGEVETFVRGVKAS